LISITDDLEILSSRPFLFLMKNEQAVPASVRVYWTEDSSHCFAIAECDYLV